MKCGIFTITAEGKHKQETQKTNGEHPSDAEQQANTIPDTPVEQASTSVPAEKLPTTSAPRDKERFIPLVQSKQTEASRTCSPTEKPKARKQPKFKVCICLVCVMVTHV